MLVHVVPRVLLTCFSRDAQPLLRADLEECDVQTFETTSWFFFPRFTLNLSCLLLQGYGDRDIV